MTERAIRISSDTAGEFVATRTAYEQDQSANVRVIQRFDLSSEHGPSPLGTAIRGSSGTLNTVDTFDLSSAPSDLTSNLIDVGDKAMLVVQIELDAVTTYDITVTPIMFDAQATPAVMGILNPKIFTLQYNFSKVTNNQYIMPAQTWDVSGAHNIGLHFTNWADSGNAINVKIYGWVI